MTNRQKQILLDAFTLMMASARRGKRMVDNGASFEELNAHLESLAGLVRETSGAVMMAAGAGAVLDIVDAALAKPLPRHYRR